mmetsp:Transcript_9533/g.15498  ORF Transcript_9533/g.15498 Transcript_9533/m.15498 type:complete len:220 (-) Transcript_9533:8-667(-)
MAVDVLRVSGVHLDPVVALILLVLLGASVVDLLRRLLVLRPLVLRQTDAKLAHGPLHLALHVAGPARVAAHCCHLHAERVRELVHEHGGALRERADAHHGALCLPAGPGARQRRDVKLLALARVGVPKLLGDQLIGALGVGAEAVDVNRGHGVRVADGAPWQLAFACGGRETLVFKAAHEDRHQASLARAVDSKAVEHLQVTEICMVLVAFADHNRAAA